MRSLPLAPARTLRSSLGWSFRPHRRILALLLLAIVGCGGGTEAQLLEVHARHDVGEFSGSIDTLREILDRQPDHFEANHLLGVALVRTGRSSLAIWPLAKAAASEEYAVPAGLLLSWALLQTLTFEEAVRAADRVLELEPVNVTALELRARANLGTASYEETLADTERILVLDPDDIEGHAMRGAALFGLGRWDEAEAALRASKEVSELSNDPGQAVNGCVALAVFYQERKEEEHATVAFNECVEAYPGAVMVVRLMSNFLAAGGRAEEAVEVWRDAVAETPDLLAFRVGLAERLERRGQLEEAGAVLTEAAELFDSAPAWSRLSRFHQERGDLDQAVRAIERALERASGEGLELRFRQADLLVGLGELERAEELASGLEETSYRDLIRGRILLARGHHAEAYERLDAGLEQWPNNSSARYLAGLAAERTGRLRQAIGHYREAVRIDAAETDAALAAARLYLADGSFEDAVQFARTQVARRPFAGPEPYLVAARASTALGNFAAARRTLDALDRTPEQAQGVLVERAALERRASGPAAAARVVEESELDLTAPAHHPALRSLAGDLVALGRLDEALTLATRARERNPDSPDAHALRARLLVRAERLDEAQAGFEAALALDPEHAAALDGVGRITAHAGRIDEGVALLDRAAAVSDPGEFDSGYRAARLRLAQGNLVEAESRLRDVVGAAPGHPNACNDLAWLLAERGADLELAQRLAERAVRIAPSAEFLDTLGWVELKRGETGAAIVALEKALESDRSSPSVRYRLGIAFEAAGRDEEALAAFREAVGSRPFPELEAARAQIARLEASR